MQIEGPQVTAAKQIRNLLLLLGSAVVCALLAVTFMVRYYGPLGDYSLQSILLSPSMMGKFQSQEMGPSGDKVHYVYHQTEFLYQEPDSRMQKRAIVSHSVYERLYQELSGDRSILGDKAEVLNHFQNAPIATLVLSVNPQYQVAHQSKSRVFQEVQFSATGDYYRVELSDDQAERQWAYFQHDGICKFIFELIDSE